MDTIVPIQFQQQLPKFQTPIKKVKQIYRLGNSVYYDAVTSYGSMTLVVENYQRDIQGFDSVKFLGFRNGLMSREGGVFPVVYEQHVCINHPQQILCISLIQKCQPFYPLAQHLHPSISSLTKYLNCLQFIQKNDLGLQSLDFKQLMYYENQGDIGVDFTKIVPRVAGKEFGEAEIREIKGCVGWFVGLVQRQEKQFVIIQDRLYRVNPELLDKASDITELSLLLNIPKDQQVQIQLKNLVKSKQSTPQSPTKLRTKTIPISQLHGKQTFKMAGKPYTLTFIEGKCMDALEEIKDGEGWGGQVFELIRRKLHFRITKRECLYMEIIRHGELADDVLVVEEGVEKIEFISFIIMYLKIKQPIITAITFVKQPNSLKLRYTTKTDIESFLKLIFPPSYIIKDEQISMILQRSKLKSLRLDLRYMKINDTLLMFLANSQKTGKIAEIHVSDCYGITDNGINVLMMSPFCKKIQAFSLVLDQNLFQPSLQALALKPELKRLHLQSNKQYEKHEHQVEINLRKLKIGELSVLGLKLSLEQLNFQGLRVLRISQPIVLDDLKLFRNAQLIQLRIRLIDLSKKSLIQSTSSFISGALISKNNPVRAFAQGPSSKTLKHLDLSDSSTKFKTLKYLFTMPQLQKLTLNSCSNIGHEFEPISPKILHLSLMRTQISISGLQDFIDRSSIIVELNLIGNQMIAREDFVKFVTARKKFINNLVIDQRCYSNKLIERGTGGSGSGSGGFELVENVGLYVGKLIEDQNQQTLFHILSKVMETPKVLRLLTQFSDKRYNIVNGIDQRSYRLERIIAKVNRFIKGCGKEERHLKNLSINNLQFHQANQKFKRRKLLIPGQKETVQTFFPSGMKLNVPQSYCISKLTHLISKLPPNINSLCLNLRNNKTLDKKAISMVRKYAQNIVTDIDFRNCIFNLDDVIEDLFQLPMLSSINNGIGSLFLDSTNFGLRSQKYLKLFMKLRELKEFSIKCSQIDETQILYSVLYHIVDKHAESMAKLSVQLTGLAINYDGDIFLNKVFDLVGLEDLDLGIVECGLGKNGKKESLFQGINRLTKLKRVRLRLPASCFPVLSLKSLEYISIGFSDEQISEHDLNKIMKHLHWSPIKHFELDLSNCSHIVNLNRLFSLNPSSTLLEKLHSLQTLSLNFEYCPLKQPTLYQLLHSISKLPQLKQINFNTSFAVSNLNQLVNKVNLMVIDAGREIEVNFVCATANSGGFCFNRQYFQANGIHFLF